MLDSPYRLTALTVAAGLLAAAGFLCGNLNSVRGWWPIETAIFVVTVLGILTMGWAAYTLREGVRNERWASDTVAPIRRVIQHRAWLSVHVLLFIAILVTFLTHPHHRNGTLWAFLLVAQTQTQVAIAFARQSDSRITGSLMNLSTVAPLTSDHWGEQ